LERIGATIEQKWGLEGKNEKERRGLRMAPVIVRRRKLCRLPSVKLIVLFFILIVIFFL